MTRPEYTVTWEGGQFVKFSWNSARENIVPTLRAMLKPSEVFERIKFEGERDERGMHIKGKEVWTSNLGRKIEFTILRTKESH